MRHVDISLGAAASQRSKLVMAALARWAGLV